MKDITVGLFNGRFVPIMDGVTLTVRNYAYWLNKDVSAPRNVVVPYVPFHIDEESFPVIRFLSVPTFVRPPYRIGLPEIDIKLQRLLKKKDSRSYTLIRPFRRGIIRSQDGAGEGHTHDRHFPLQIPRRPDQGYLDQGHRGMTRSNAMVDFYYSVDYVWVPQEGVAATLREYGLQGPLRGHGKRHRPQSAFQHRAAAGEGRGGSSRGGLGMPPRGGPAGLLGL